MVTLVGKLHRNGHRIKEITPGSLCFNQGVLAQGQQFGRIRTMLCGRNGICKIALLVPYRAVFANHIFGSTNFKHCTGQILFFIHRHMHFVSPGIYLHIIARQLQTGFVQQDSALYRLVGNLNGQLVGIAGKIRIVANKHGKIIRMNEVPFRCFHFLQVIHPPIHCFRQCHRASFIRHKSIYPLFTGVMYLMLDIVTICILQFERSVCQRNGISGFRIHFDETQAIQNGQIVQSHGRRVHQVFRTINLKRNGAFDLITGLTFCLFQHINTIRQRFGHGIAVFIRYQHIPFIFTGSFKAAGTL